MKLFLYQQKVINEFNGKSCGIYYDMGLGKTFIGSELAIQSLPCLIVCQASKVDDWINHINENYPDKSVANLRKEKNKHADFYVINYDLLHRRDLPKNCTLLLDESQYIKNASAKRTKVIMRYKPKRVILLSGTPCGGKYEELYTQLKLLGLNQTKRQFIDEYCIWHKANFGTGFDVMVIDGYKNIDHLKEIMKNLNCDFMTTDEANIELPEQRFYEREFKKDKFIRELKKDKYTQTPDGIEWVADCTMSEMIAERILCSTSKERLNYFEDTLNSTDKQMVVFYNFNYELSYILEICKRCHKSKTIINGENHTIDTDAEVTIVQYQAGASGLNLQYADTIYYFSLPLSSIDFEQSKKRIHRIGQSRSCLYIIPFTKCAVDDKIYKRLKIRKDYTEQLYLKDVKEGD